VSSLRSDDLFSAVRLGSYVLPNRIVMAPMTRSRATPDGVPSSLAATYYAQRATAGLIITEATQVSPEGVGYPGTPGIYTEAQATRWRSVTRAVHAQHGRIFLQLWHVGRVSHPSMQPEGRLPVAPSAIAPEGGLFTSHGMQRFVTPRAIDSEEIGGLVAQFARAAQLALDAGFDGIDIHAANGYLIDQFLRDGSNRRSDAYGGSVPNRARFLLEVVEAVMSVWGAARVGVRISPLQPYNSMQDSDPQTLFSHVATMLGRFGIGYLHVVEPGSGHPMATAQGLDMLRLLRVAFRGRMIVDGGRDRASAESALANSEADLVALATPFIANPDLVERLSLGLPLASPDPAVYYEGGARGYTDYPVFAPAQPDSLSAQG
jgi:N-ethylmaleimide reductase